MQLKKQLLIIMTLTLAEIKSRYRNTFVGLIWVILNPLIQFSVHALIFKFILKLNIERYYIFLLTGLLPWIYISTTLTSTVNTMVSSREALLSFQIHPISIVISKSIDNFINFVIPFIALFFILLPTENFDFQGFAFLPLAMIIIFISVTYASILFSILQVFFRDVQYVLNFVTGIMLFLTPIFYPRHLIPENYQFLVDLNPFYAFIRTFKASLWHFSVKDIIYSLGYSSLFLIIITIITTFTWKKVRNEFYLQI
jgi:ABC-type polysaccharide/polyol phosphate export permease